MSSSSSVTWLSVRSLSRSYTRLTAPSFVDQFDSFVLFWIVRYTEEGNFCQVCEKVLKSLADGQEGEGIRFRIPFQAKEDAGQAGIAEADGGGGG